MGFGLCFDDVGIGTCVTVECPDPVVVERVCSQTSNGEASHIANVQIAVGWRESTKRTAERNVQAVTGRTADTCPVRSKAVESLIGVL